MMRAPKTSLHSVLLATSCLVASAFAAPADANPTGGNIVSGKGVITHSGRKTTIDQTSNGAFIDWDSFSIGAGNTVFFNNGAGATLNKVTG